MKLKFIEPDKNWIVHVTDEGNNLRKPSKTVSTPLSYENQAIANKMYSYIEAGKSIDYQEKGIAPGIGIAAPQIGHNVKMIYISFFVEKNDKSGYKDFFFANPEIIDHSNKICVLKGGEGCLSIKEKIPGYTPRYRQITVKAYDVINEKNIVIQSSGFLSIVFQHEIDHINGILYPDRINKENPWEKKREWKLI